MSRSRTRAAAAAAALGALALAAGSATFLAARDDPVPPRATTTTTTSTTIPDSALAAAIAGSLIEHLGVALDGPQAGCIATGLVELLGRDRLRALATAPSPFAALSDAERDGLVRSIVRCVPAELAAALLATTTTTAATVAPQG